MKKGRRELGPDAFLYILLLMLISITAHLQTRRRCLFSFTVFYEMFVAFPVRIADLYYLGTDQKPFRRKMNPDLFISSSDYLHLYLAARQIDLGGQPPVLAYQIILSNPYR